MSYEQVLLLIQEIESGNLDNLICPKCNKKTARVQFTNPKTNVYKTWVLCGVCGYRNRMQNSKKPKYYDKKRVDLELQNLDREIEENRRFPNP